MRDKRHVQNESRGVLGMTVRQSGGCRPVVVEGRKVQMLKRRR
jgi:hypothetical protein